MATSKKAAPRKAAKKPAKKVTPKKRSKKSFKRSIEPLNLSKAIEQPVPNAQQVFNNLKEQSTGFPTQMQNLNPNFTMPTDEQTQKHVQEYMDYKASNPKSVQSKSFAIFTSYKLQGMLEPPLYDGSLEPVKLSANNGELSNTDGAYLLVVDTCMKTFAQKLADYGASWRIFRMKSIADQIFIKANRIRAIQDAGVQKIGDTIVSEYIGIVNYGIMAMIQMKLMPTIEEEDNHEGIGNMYDLFTTACFETMQKKNHDYGESWKFMQLESFCDMILVRLKRIQQILSNNGNIQYSEPLDQNFIDIVNYAIFALIRYDEKSIS